MGVIAVGAVCVSPVVGARCAVPGPIDAVVDGAVLACAVLVILCHFMSYDSTSESITVTE